jgi:hypothetical protein
VDASTFGSAAASGLTVAKMIEAKRIMRKAQVDMEEETLTWVTNSQGESDLLNQVQVVSTDFSDRPVLTDGKVTRFLGWDIVYSERLPSASNVRSNIPFANPASISASGRTPRTTSTAARISRACPGRSTP